MPTPQELAAAQAELDRQKHMARLTAHAAHQAELDAAKAQCLEGESEDAHAAHKAQLQAAYQAFSGQDPSESNPAKPDAVTSLTADVAVTAEPGA